MPEQPLTTEGEYLLYLLQASADGALPAWHTNLLGDVTWLERQERAALYALGRIRESVCHRVKRLEPGEPRTFLVHLLAFCQDDDGGRVIAPRWPASNLGEVVGKIRHRLFTSNARAA